ncbi:MAG: M14 family metallopeptidase [Bacteriovorax sp.]
MIRSAVLSLLFIILISTAASAHQHSPLDEFQMSSTMIAKVQFANYKTGMRKLNQLHLDIAGIDIKNKSADVVISDAEFKKLESLGFNVSMTMSKSLMRQPDAEYKTSSEIEVLLKDFNGRYPDLTQLHEVGKSLQGRSIWAISITSQNKKSAAEKPTILFNGMHHAREVMGPEIALDIIETLLNGYGKDSKITHWIDSNKIWVLPMFNVDGNNIVWGKDNMWRKNARDNYGVDLNRNYPYAWGKCNGSSSSRSAQDYRGPSAASEPETKVMMNLVKDIRPVFDISYHSYSELVIYPLGCKGQRTQNADVVEAIGKEMGSKLGYTAGTAWETLYSVDGGDIDWMYATYQVIPYVIEVNSSSDGFQPDYSKRRPTAELNRKAWMHLLDRLDGPGIRGQVNAGEFNVLVQKKNGGQYIDYMNYVGNPDGTFHAVVSPGEYRVIVSGPELKKYSQDVSVTNSRLQLNFKL